VYACPVLIEPQENSVQTGTITFRWQSVGALQLGDVYEVRVWQGDKEKSVGRTPKTEWLIVDPSLVQGTGVYQWRVVVVRPLGGDVHPDWQIVSPLPGANAFFWARGDQPASESGGG
jgi:hypothetical protein